MFDFSGFLTDIYAIGAAALMLIAVVYLSFFYALYYVRVGRYERKRGKDILPDMDDPQPPVSVVLTVRNQSEWIKDNIAYLLEQQYPDFEVVVVDYLSEDDTQYVLQTLQEFYKNLKVVSFHEDVNIFQGKKYPLSMGIRSAKNDILLLADVDCLPKNLNWISGMVRGYRRENTQIVIGFCGVNRGKGLFNALQRYDAVAFGCNYIGAALLRKPYTASERCLSYRRSFFFDCGAFISHYNVADGADDLFVYQNATRRNTRVCINDDACLMADAKKKFSTWHFERLHRVGTRSRHTFFNRLREQWQALSCVAFYGSAVFLLLNGSLPWIVVAALVLLKWIWQIVAFSVPARRFKEGGMYWLAPLFEIYFVFANTCLILTHVKSNRKFE